MQKAKQSKFLEYGQWVDSSRNLAAKSLQYCPDFAERASRHEAWWRCQNTSPLFLAKGLSSEEAKRSRCFEKLANPAEWLADKLLDLHDTHFLFDSLPFIQLDLGGSMLAGMLGAKIHYDDDHAWITSLFSEWGDQPEWQLDQKSETTRLLNHLTDALLPELTGKAMLMSPNLGGGADALMNLMSAEMVCQSLIDHPDEVHTALEGINAVWRDVYSKLTWAVIRNKVGMIHWCELWSNTPYLILECELAALVSSKHFHQFLIPDILRQAESVDRTIFHVCGEESFRHIDALLNLPQVSAIQYVPGRNNRAIHKIHELQKIQKHGLPLQISVMPDEPAELLKELEPAGLAFLILDALPMDRLQPFVKTAAVWNGQ